MFFLLLSLTTLTLENLNHTKGYYQNFHTLQKFLGLDEPYGLILRWYLYVIWDYKNGLVLKCRGKAHRRQLSTLNARKYTILFPCFCKQRWLRLRINVFQIAFRNLFHQENGRSGRTVRKIVLPSHMCKQLKLEDNKRIQTTRFRIIFQYFYSR